MAITHQLKSMPAPVGGLNARDSVANMPPTDATKLVNWVPDSYGVKCRKGYREWAINFPADAAVKSVMAYFSPSQAFPSGTFLTAPTTMPGALFAATDTAIYTITSATNAPASAIALSGTSNAGWFSHAITSNSGGNFLMACSEADGYFTYDGTNWLRRVAGAGAGQINGVNPNNLVHVNVWKRRAWFVERDTTKVWYLATDAIAGTATSLDLGPLFKKGGSLAFTASWTIDAGEGIDDFFVACSSNGEVALYKGTDPSSATTFTLQGVWYIGQIPVGRRCYSHYGGDLLIVSTDGIVPLSEVTRGGSGLLSASNKEYSSKISILVGDALRNSFTFSGWHMHFAPADRLLLCSIPDYGTQVNKQFALATVINQWCVLSDIPTLCYGMVGSYTFAGTSTGKVLLLFQDYSDNVAYGELVGDPIAGEIITAASDFGLPAQQKQFIMVRVNFVGPFEPGVAVDVIVDYADYAYQAVPYSTGYSASAWTVAEWGTGVWAAGTRNSFGEWTTANGVGAAGAAHITTSCVADTVLTRIDYLTLPGGPI